jgi:hypothetical protein
MWQPGKVISNKVNTIHTYLTTTNYWVPLHKTEEDDHIEDSNIPKVVQSIANMKSNKWTCQVEWQRTMKLVINSGATSKFVPEETNLPKKGKSNKEILTAQYQIASILQNWTPLQAINQQSKRGRHLTRTQDTPHEHKQSGQRRIHNSVPSRRKEKQE